MAQERRDVMLRRISILGGDLRQRWLAEELRQCGFEVAVYQVPELENTFSSLQQTVKSAQALALRIRLTGGELNMRHLFKVGAALIANPRNRYG